MKRIFLLIIMAGLLFTACNKTNSENKDYSQATKGIPGEKPVFKFEREIYDFGTINEGEIVTYTYKYKNVGGSDLIITSAKGSCGCTVPKWSHEPLAPGEEGNIEVQFSSSGKSGKQNKVVVIYANTSPETIELRITGEVKSKEK